MSIDSVYSLLRDGLEDEPLPEVFLSPPRLSTGATIADVLNLIDIGIALMQNEGQRDLPRKATSDLNDQPSK